MKTKGKRHIICSAAIAVILLIGVIVHFLMPTTVKTFVSGLKVSKMESGEMADTYGTWTYNVKDDNTIEITGYTGNEAITEIEIPSTIDEKAVTTLGTGVFSNCISLIKINVPDTVTTIGSRAFENCTELSEVTLNEGILTIKDGAFYGCSKLRNIVIPDSVTYLEGGIFNGCENITIMTSYTKGYSNNIYSGCTNFSVILTEKTIHIEEAAFSDCLELKSITIPNSVTEIKEYAFSDCTSLTEITIPSSVTSIGSNAFRSSNSLNKITILNSATIISGDAFEQCDNLTIYGYAGSTAQICASNNGITFVAIEDYKVEHYTENLDETYTLDDTENLIGNLNETVTAVPKTTYERFTYDNSIEGTVESGIVVDGGSLVLKLYYIRNRYTVQYNSNDGIGTMENQLFKYGEEKNLTKNVFTKEGHIFIGWNTEEDGTGNAYKDENTMIREDFINNDLMTLFAQWKAIPTRLTATYGETLADVELPEGFSWEVDATTSVGNIGENTFTVKYTPDDTVNYNEVIGIEVVVVVERATPTVTAPTGLTAIYGETLADVELPAGFSFEQELTTSVGNAGENTFTVKYSPEDTVNYKEVTGINVTIEVGKATPTVTAPTNLVAIVGDTLADVELPAGFSFEQELTTSVGNAGENTFTVKYTPADTVNYNEVTGINVIITVTETERLRIHLGKYKSIVENEINYIVEITSGTKISSFRNELITSGTNGSITVSKNNNPQGEESKLETGMDIKIALNNESVTYKAVVKGDITGDGEVTMADVVGTARYVGKTNTQVEPIAIRAMEVANVDEKNEVNMADLVKLARYVGKKITEL